MAKRPGPTGSRWWSQEVDKQLGECVRGTSYSFDDAMTGEGRGCTTGNGRRVDDMVDMQDAL